MLRLNKKVSRRADQNNGGGILLIENNTSSSSVIFVDDENMVVEILSRLPVKSLLRFKCVSKRWCSLIQDPYFVDLHSARSTTRPGATFFVSRDYSGRNITFFGSTNYDGPHFYAVDYISYLHAVDSISFIGFDTFGPHIFILRYFRIYNNKLRCTQILNGLLFMSLKEETIWIMNPSIRKTILVTKTNIKEEEEEEAINNKNVVSPAGGIYNWMNLECLVEPKYGFGLDPVTKKYKVICICKVYMYYVPPEFFHYNPAEGIEHDFNPLLLKIYNRCKVLTIEDVVADSCWRRIDEIPARRLTSNPVYLNGALYWTSMHLNEENNDDYDQVIVAFDLSTEKFSVIKTPASFVPSGSTAYLLGHDQDLYEVDGYLAILDNTTTGLNNTIEIWKLVVVPPEGANAATVASCWVKETILTLSFDWRKEGYLFEVIGGTNQILLKRCSPSTSFCYYNRDNYLVDDHENKTKKKKTSTCDGEKKKKLEFTGKAASFTDIQLPDRSSSSGIIYRAFHTCTESLWSFNSSSSN